MKQLFVNNGQIEIHDVPEPPLDDRGILAKTTIAAVSIGTETNAMHPSKLSPFVRLLTSPEYRQKAVRKIKEGRFLSNVKREFGLIAPTKAPQTFNGQPMGYSCVGCVLAVGRDVHGVRAGDRAACAGSGHAEVVYVPQNLFVLAPEGVSDAAASFVALGSIAIHSVRQAELSFGETAVIMGLGMVGQLIAQVAQATGVRTIVCDLLESRMDVAVELGATVAVNPHKHLIKKIMELTDGFGADVLFLCMGGSSPEPLRQAMEMARERGRVVVVGTPELTVPRELFYNKELDLRIARSYGPGRYDPDYEEGGIDYPIGYVRWTERRNMAEYLRLVQTGKIHVDELITTRFAFENARDLYSHVTERPEDVIGAVLTCAEVEAPAQAAPATLETTGDKLGIAVVGAGVFARNFHLPNIASSESFRLEMVVARTKRSAQSAADRFGATLASTNIRDALNNPKVDLVLICTRHGLHAKQSIAALEAGKAVFSEKPIGISEKDAKDVLECVRRTNGFYAIGFNKRFAPVVARAKELLAGRKTPLVMVYRVAGSFIPADHWTYDPKVGGGPIIGEMCHFFDLLSYLCDSKPVELFAVGGTLSHQGTNLNDNVIVTISFADGSIGTVAFVDSGRRPLLKEHIEIFCGDGAITLDFRGMEVYGFSSQRGMRLKEVDKGYVAELEAVSKALMNEQPSPLPVEIGVVAMKCCLATIESVRTGKPQKL